MSGVLDCLRDFSFSEKEKHIAVALSGGADSMALLMGLYMLREELGLTISAVHINHCLRGEESDRDEAFVRKQCNALNIPLAVEKIDVAQIAREEKISVELAARQERYRVFEQTVCDALATAHNSDDNLETVLFRLTRSTGLSGLCGIPPRRGKIIRPLLYCSRDQVEAFCRENAIAFVTDSTNLSDDFTRNRIRHSVVPVLKSLNPSLLTSFSKTVELLTNDRDYLDSIALEEFDKRYIDSKLNIQGIESLPRAVSSRVISSFLKSCGYGGNYSVSGVLGISEKGSGRFELTGGKMIKASNGFLAFEDNDTLPHFVTQLKKESVDLIKQQGKIHNLLLKNAIDCDKIVGKLVIRTRLPGDSVTFAHRNVSKPLRKWMNEEEINPILRDILPVIADNNGVVWVYGGGVVKRVCPDENTKNIIKVICEKE